MIWGGPEEIEKKKFLVALLWGEKFLEATLREKKNYFSEAVPGKKKFSSKSSSSPPPRSLMVDP